MRNKPYESIDKPENLSLRANIVLAFAAICIAFAVVWFVLWVFGLMDSPVAI